MILDKTYKFNYFFPYVRAKRKINLYFDSLCLRNYKHHTIYILSFLGCCYGKFDFLMILKKKKKLNE